MQQIIPNVGGRVDRMEILEDGWEKEIVTAVLLLRV